MTTPREYEGDDVAGNRIALGRDGVRISESDLVILVPAPFYPEGYDLLELGDLELEEAVPTPRIHVPVGRERPDVDVTSGNLRAPIAICHRVANERRVVQMCLADGGRDMKGHGEGRSRGNGLRAADVA